MGGSIHAFHAAILALVISLLITRCAEGVAAGDNASDQPYASSGGVWASGQNGGSGFAAWNLNVSPVPTGVGTFFVGASSSIDTNFGFDSSVTSPQSWGMTAEPGDGTIARRPLTSPMSVGDKMSFNMKNGPVFDGGAGLTVSIHPIANTLVQVDYFQGFANYQYRDKTGLHDSGIPITFTGINVAVTLTSPTNYSLDLTPLGGSATTFAGQLLTTVVAPGIEFANQNTVANGQSETHFFNSLVVVPEPASFLMLAVTAMLRLRRR